MKGADRKIGRKNGIGKAYDRKTCQRRVYDKKHVKENPEKET